MLLVQWIQTLSFSGVPLYRPISRLMGATPPLNLARHSYAGMVDISLHKFPFHK